MPIVQKRCRRVARLTFISTILISPGLLWADGLPPLARVIDEVSSQETALAGSRVVIGPDGPFPVKTTFRWTQVEGPTVSIGDPTSAKLRFVAPSGAAKVAFQLAIRGDQGEKLTRVTVPIAAAPTPSAGGTVPEVVADGGDDQIGLVGRRITLNGTRSRPAGRVGHRWIQVAGPSVGSLVEDGGYCSFEPTAPGDYRFALVVAARDQISLPDFVTVEVGVPPSHRAAVPATASGAFAMGDSAEQLRSAVASAANLPSGPSTISEVADVLEAIAARVPLYKTYGELQSEMSRRLDVIIPSSPALRAAWTTQVFVPLSQALAPELAALGIDPRAPEPGRGLDSTQKDRLKLIYRELSGAFRSRLAGE